jgi:hypothetical protein
LELELQSGLEQQRSVAAKMAINPMRLHSWLQHCNFNRRRSIQE